MKKAIQLKPLLLSMAVAGSAALSVAPTVAQAEVSYNAAVSNFYLWRGTDISAGAPAVSGGIDWSADSGLYAGMWTSSEEAGTEFDLYFGYGFAAGDFGMNLAYWGYFYPSDGAKSSFTSKDGSYASEYEITATYGDFGLTAMIEAEDREDIYYNASYGFGDFGFAYGYYDFDAGGDYNHIDISYAATDNLSFTLVKANGPSEAAEKPLINMSYSFTF